MIDAIGPTWLLPLLVAPFAGSFLGVLIVRLPAGLPVAFVRSVCPQCGATLSSRELLPLASFLLQRGNCRHCRRPIGLFHPAVELAAMAVAAWAMLADSDTGRAWIDCGLGWTLLTLAWIDWTDFILPDVLTLPLLLAGLAMTFARQPEALTDHSLAAVVAYLAFQGLALAYRWFRGQDGLGGGDTKLLAAAGAWCGLAALPFAVLFAALLGLLAALGLALSGRCMTSRTPLPFGPCLALSFWIVWLHGGLVEGLTEMLGRP